MKKSLILLLHLGYWGMYAILLVIIFAGMRLRVTPHPSLWELLLTNPAGIIAVVPNVFAFYGFYLWVFPKFLRPRKTSLFILASILVAFASTVICCVWLYVAREDMRHLFFNWEEVATFMTFLPFVALVHGTLALVIRGFVTWLEELKTKEELAKKNFDMEMALVKSQISPHFLFNTLNNIDVLIGKDSTKASAYLNKLSDIMRFMLYETKTERIPLQKEWEYLEKYIELQKIRTANPDFVQYSLEGDSKNVFIAPMTLIPFVENAFKHAEGLKADRSIVIRACVVLGAIDFQCDNKYMRSDLPKTEASGLGNELIMKRLALLYPEKHSLHIQDKDGMYSVRLGLFGKKLFSLV